MIVVKGSISRNIDDNLFYLYSAKGYKKAEEEEVKKSKGRPKKSDNE